MLRAERLSVVFINVLFMLYLYCFFVRVNISSLNYYCIYSLLWIRIFIICDNWLLNIICLCVLKLFLFVVVAHFIIILMFPHLSTCVHFIFSFVYIFMNIIVFQPYVFYNDGEIM